MQPRFLLDTNTIIYIRRDQPQAVLRNFQKLRPGEAALSVITFGELMYGVAKSSQKTAAEAALREIVQALPVLALPQEAAAAYGAIRTELERKGQPIGNNDLWIAAHAVAAELVLVTNNEREFRRIPGLKIQNWAV